METILALLQVLTYFMLLVLAGYLLNRGAYHPLSIATAAALISYALIQADGFLHVGLDDEAMGVRRVLWAAYPIPAVAWARVGVLLQKDESLTLDRAWWTLLLPVTVLFILGGWIGDALINFETGERGALYWSYVLYNLLVELLTTALLYRRFRVTAPTDRLRILLGWLILAGVAYAGGMLLLLVDFFSPAFIFTIVTVDVAILGLVGIGYDALAEGQAVRRDLLLTLIKTVLVMIALVLPWLLASREWTTATALAMFFTLGMVALGSRVLERFEDWLYRYLFSEQAAETRDALRTLMQNTQRQPETSELLLKMDQDEFIRLTRRALSHLPNLPRLAASPLTEMQVIKKRIAPDANTLERAAELRRVLLECIETLRPNEAGYGTSDEWRFFNALYYPYVAGLSPYKRAFYADSLPPETETILRWFQVHVPPRTLYNWQNKAAELIADILLEQERKATA